MRGGGHREASADDSSSDAAPTRARFSSRAMPPIVLRLQLQDKTTYPITVEIREVNSALGNFAVRPDQLSLAPGQPTETEPMSSTLGADSSELPVTVTLRVGGQSETKVLTLHPVENQTP